MAAANTAASVIQEQTKSISSIQGDGGGGGAENQTVMYTAERIIGNGSFGVVFRATVAQTGEVVAIKKVLQDKRFKNRELQIMRKLTHPNIVQLKNCFYSNKCVSPSPTHTPPHTPPTNNTPHSSAGAEELYLNLVLEYMPETVYGIALAYNKSHETMPLLSVKVYVYQLCRALAYLHAMGICHRDIKPQNLLVDPSQHILKLCDFGSAKQLVSGEPNVSYICSRYYRAPELIFGATDYSTQIDTWSLGCVAAELLIGRPLFPGRDCVEQLVEIFQILGTPIREEIEAMNPSYTDFRFTHVARRNWNVQCNYTQSPELIEFVSRTLAYSPTVRIKPIEACVHPAFDELRGKNVTLSDGKPLPKGLFDFTYVELAVNPELNPKLLAHG